MKLRIFVGILIVLLLATLAFLIFEPFEKEEKVTLSEEELKNLEGILQTLIDFTETTFKLFQTPSTKSNQ